MSLKSLLNYVDMLSSAAHVRLMGDKPGLTSFLFHACLENAKDYDSNVLYPQERLTVRDLEDFIEYFLEKKYVFLSPDDLLNGHLNASVHYALLTFDDGYFNNHLVVDVLKKYDVPAIFYVPTLYLFEEKKFWSDALYFFRKKQFQSDGLILKEIMYLKSQRLPIIEDYMVKNFGKDALKPLNSIDRFMTESEFIEFSRKPNVYIGNHTHTHEILTHLNLNEISEELYKSQTILEMLIGYSPKIISYPNGSMNDSVIKVSYDAGFEYGQTTIMKKNSIPLEHSQLGQKMIHRFNPIVNKNGFDFENFRSDFQLKTQLKKWIN